jgi:hypothetical protein
MLVWEEVLELHRIKMGYCGYGGQIVMGNWDLEKIEKQNHILPQ